MAVAGCKRIDTKNIGFAMNSFQPEVFVCLFWLLDTQVREKAYKSPSATLQVGRRVSKQCWCARGWSHDQSPHPFQPRRPEHSPHTATPLMERSFGSKHSRLSFLPFILTKAVLLSCMLHPFTMILTATQKQLCTIRYNTRCPPHVSLSRMDHRTQEETKASI